MKCSVRFAILLEIIANLYVHRREIRHSKRGQARRQHRQRKQVTERKQAALAAYTHTGRQAQEKEKVPWRQWGPPLAWGA
jgi:hypothetical protein